MSEKFDVSSMLKYSYIDKNVTRPKFLWYEVFPNALWSLVPAGIGTLLCPNFTDKSDISIFLIIYILSNYFFVFINLNNKYSTYYDTICKELKYQKIYYSQIIENYILLKEGKIHTKVADLITDLNTFEYELSETCLQNKKRPAIKEVKRIKELRKKTKEIEKKEKLMRYEYENLFALFPELENYIDFVESNTNESIADVKDNYDYVQNWISKEDYKALPEDKRNQLALDKYVKSSKKSKWQIGRDYEMFIGQEYASRGYRIEYTGIQRKINDHGRDLVASKGNEVLIIQCKNWSQEKLIHENHICQLYGTTIQYSIENEDNNLQKKEQIKITPVFVTSTKLSDTARKFADALKVKVIEEKKLEDFPRIKCNINGDNKIYHLPFDQQYDRTVIGNVAGEFFAWTVEEASQKGFRRAKKYFFTKE